MSYLKCVSYSKIYFNAKTLIKFLLKMYYHYSIFLSLMLIMLVNAIMIAHTEQKSINKTLQFDSNRNFTILQFTDLHYGEGDLKNLQNMNLSTYLIKLINPDIVIVTGDAISGYMYHGQSNFFYNNWIDFVSPFNQNEQLYAYTIGNHDEQGDLNREEIAKLDMTNPYSLFTRSYDIDGISNYYLPVYSHNSTNVSAILWLFDSGDKGCGEVINCWGCVKSSQVNWYNQTSWKLKEKYGNKTHGIAFMHVPPLEFMYLYNHEPFYGEILEGVSCPVLNTGLINTFIENQDITGLFVGHDHGNSFGGWWNGVELVYGRKTGYGGYDSKPDYVYGARVIVLQELIDEQIGEVINVKRSHYIVYENGTLEYEQNYRRREENLDGKMEFQRICALPGIDSALTYFIQLVISSLSIKIIMIISQRGLLMLNEHKILKILMMISQKVLLKVKKGKACPNLIEYTHISQEDAISKTS